VRSKNNLRGGQGAPCIPAITGRGVASAAGAGLKALAEALASGGASWRNGGRGREKGGDGAGFFAPPGGEAAPRDLRASGSGPGHCAGRAGELAALAFGEALEEAFGAWPEPPLSESVGLAFGTALGPAGELEAWAARGAPLTSEEIEGFSFGSCSPPAAGALGGPRSVFSSTCVSGLCAVEQAIADLAFGRARAMLAGATDTLSASMRAGFTALKALSPGGRLRPFDSAHDGIVLGEAASAVVLEPLDRAVLRGAAARGCILGRRLIGDAFHPTSPDPEGEAMAKAIFLSLADAGLGPADVGCITVTAAGSPAYDRMLSLAVEKALGEEAARRIPVTTWEPAIGHVLAATGILALAHATWLLEEGRVHAACPIEESDPLCRLRYLTDGPEPLGSPVVLGLVVGFGGQNGAVVVASPEVAFDRLSLPDSRAVGPQR
jgi:3-oxoacyl-[acyl-carrier-protein] synthase II